MMNQFQMLHDYNKVSKIPFNPELFERSNEKIIEALENIILSCQRSNQYFSIKVLQFTVVDDYDQINRILKRYYDKMSKNKNGKKKENPYEYINLKESEVLLLIVKYNIKVKDEEEILDVIIMVPRIVDDYYIVINGIKYLPLYQIVDGSTYNNNSSTVAKNPSITMKLIFMVTRLYRRTQNFQTINKEKVKCYLFMSNLFNKSTPALAYTFAKYGFYGTFKYLGVRDIFVTDHPIEDPNFYCFKMDKSAYVSAPRVLYDADHMTQNVVATIMKAYVIGMDINHIYTRDFWVRSLGGYFNNYTSEKMLAVLTGSDPSITDTIDKGYSILDSFESIYDIDTKKNLRLPDDMKKDTYDIIRWIIREFNYLRMKDNQDLAIKKLRYETYIASLYGIKLVRGISRVADMNKKITLSSIIRAIRTQPNYLLRVIVKCKLVNYHNMVNDLDSLAALKYTYKGISGIGESNSNSIPNFFRSVKMSHLGRLDLDSSSPTDPGVSGTICPFTNIYNGYFSDYEEPNFWEAEFAKALEEYNSVTKLIEPIQFMEDTLGVDMTEQKVVQSEVKGMMEQLINPILFADEGEVFSLGEEETSDV